VVGLCESIQRHVRVRDKRQVWTDVQVVMALIMLNLAGGEHVEDLQGLEEDEGWCRILRQVEIHRLKRKVRQAWSDDGARGGGARCRHRRRCSAIWRHFMIGEKRKSDGREKPLSREPTLI